MADGRYRETETRISYAAWKAREEMARNERRPAKSRWRTLLTIGNSQ